jgi:hypothetical protein
MRQGHPADGPDAFTSFSLRASQTFPSFTRLGFTLTLRKFFPKQDEYQPAGREYSATCIPDVVYDDFYAAVIYRKEMLQNHPPFPK